MNASDFIYILDPDGTCNFWYCGKPGVVLAYDDFAPEIATWFCQDCWDMLGEFIHPMLTIVEDKRPQEKAKQP